MTEGVGLRLSAVHYTYPVSRRQQERVFSLKDLNLTVPRGEIITVLGSNGSGKSTLGRLIVGLLRPSKGEILIGGARAGSEEARARIGYIPQELTLDNELTGSELIELICHLEQQSSRAAHLLQLIEQFNLAPHLNKPIRECSGGVRRKFQLVLALLKAPEVLIVDEGLQQLDAASREIFWSIMRQRRLCGHTTLIISHDWHESELQSDTVALLHRGALIQSAPPSELISIHGHCRWKASFLTPLPQSSDLESALSDCQNIRLIALERLGVDLEIRHEAPITDEKLLDLIQSQGVIVSSYQRRRPDLLSAYEALTGSVQRKESPFKQGRHHG